MPAIFVPPILPCVQTQQFSLWLSWWGYRAISAIFRTLGCDRGTRSARIHHRSGIRRTNYRQNENCWSKPQGNCIKVSLVAPKTKNSRRTLPLPAVLISALQAHRARQLEEQRWVGVRWQEHGLVFPTSIGTPINSSNLVSAFHEPVAGRTAAHAFPLHMSSAMPSGRLRTR